MLDHLFEADHMTLLAGGVAVAMVLMVLMRWVGQRVATQSAAPALSGDGSFDYAIAGTDAHQPALARIAGRRPTEMGEERVAELQPSLTPAGELVAMLIQIDNARIGEIPARDLPHFHAATGGRAARCDAVVLKEDDVLVVRLDIVWPPRLA